MVWSGEDTLDSAEWRLPDTMKPPAGAIRHYSESINLTKPPSPQELRRYFRSTYDFSSPMRYKTVVFLEPRLAPIKYFRTINFGIPAHLRHKSTVYCDFRPRPCAFRETAWVFPKQGREIYTSVVEHQQLVETRWYTSRVSVSDETGSMSDTAASEEGTLQNMKSSGYVTSSAESSSESEEGDNFSDQLHSPSYNNNKKISDYYHGYNSKDMERGHYV